MLPHGPGTATATATALTSNGYEILNADQLKTWMMARIADKKLSVVVMTQDAAPDTVAETMSATCTLRKYLDAGGKIVVYGDIPFYYQSNASAANTTWGDSGAPAILGFNTSSAPRDSNNTAKITAAGSPVGSDPDLDLAATAGAERDHERDDPRHGQRGQRLRLGETLPGER